MTAPTNFVELTVFTKSDGPLTKSIHLANDGSLQQTTVPPASCETVLHGEQ